MKKFISVILLWLMLLAPAAAWDNTKPTAGDSSTTPHQLDTKIVNVGEDLYDNAVETGTTPTLTGVQMTPATAPIHSEGLMFYDSDQKTFVTYNDISGVSQNVGEETWIRVVNKTGGALSNGDVVYIDTAQGNRPTVAKAQADAHATSCGTIGVVTQTTIADNAEGIATSFGELRGYDTSGFSAGDELFLSSATAGLIVNTAPASPNYRVRIGWALNSTPDGTIFVNPKIFQHADKVYLDDAGSLITATNVEAALQENRTAIDASTDRANHTGTQATSTIVLPTINGVLTAEEQCNLLCASSYYEGGAFTDNANGAITVAAGKGFVQASDVAGAQLLSFEWAENTNVSLTDESTNYIYTSYHATTPTINSSVTKPTDIRTNVLLGKVYRHGTHVHLFKAGMVSDEFLAKIIGRFIQTEGEITHASGGVISETGTRNVASTAAVVWGGLTRGTTTQKDTSGTDTFHYFYYTGSAWTYSDLAQIDNLQYNNPASGLSTLAPNQYGVHWVYLDPDGHMMVVYGQDSYALGEAQEAQPIVSLPSQVTEFCWLAAKIIVKRSATAFTEIQSAYDTAYVASTASIHNDLGGLQGGTADEYYHLTSAELGVAQSQTDLSAIDALVASVDAVAVYHGRVADDDDPLWVEKCGWTSWYNETLNTATRGATRAFPTEYLIVLEELKYTIYDATDASLPMWRVCNAVGGSGKYWWMSGIPASSIKFLNGQIVIGVDNAGTGTHSNGVLVADYVADILTKYATNDSYNGSNLRVTDDSDATALLTGVTPDIVNYTVNDIALTRLPDAPINPATGMRYVTVAAATNGGVSVIDGPAGVGTVVDLTCSDSGFEYSYYIAFRDDGALLYNFATEGRTRKVRVQHDLPVEDTIITTVNYEKQDSDEYYVDSAGGTIYSDLSIFPSIASTDDVKFVNNWLGCQQGLNLLAPNPTTPTSGAVAYITTDYNTGMMRGDIQLATLADTTAGDVTTTISDRCIQANHLTVTGTLTKAAVATGAELMGFSEWSVNDYATLPYTSDLDNGTDDFKFLVWVKEASNSAIEVIFERDSATTAQRITARINADGTVSFTCDDNTTVRTATSTGTVDDDIWKKIEFEYSAGTLNIYINHILDGTATGAALLTLSNASAVFRVGLDVQGANPLTNGSLALLRTTKTLGTNADRTTDYLKEPPMFQEDAAITLSGASDSVLALDYDNTTENLTVLTDVVDVFNGLTNISQDTLSGTGQCVSVGNGTTLIGTSTTVTFSKPAINLREELAKAPERIKQFGYLPEQFRFTGDTSETDFNLPAGWEVWAVYDTAGALMLEGATDDYTVEDNGNNKTIVFSSAPAALDFIIFGIPEQVSRLEWPDEYLTAA